MNGHASEIVNLQMNLPSGVENIKIISFPLNRFISTQIVAE